MKIWHWKEFFAIELRLRSATGAFSLLPGSSLCYRWLFSATGDSAWLLSEAETQLLGSLLSYRCYLWVRSAAGDFALLPVTLLCCRWLCFVTGDFACYRWVRSVASDFALLPVILLCCRGLCAGVGLIKAWEIKFYRVKGHFEAVQAYAGMEGRRSRLVLGLPQGKPKTRWNPGTPVSRKNAFIP